MIYVAVFLLSLQIALLAYQISITDTKKIIPKRKKKTKGSVITAEDLNKSRQRQVDKLLNVKDENKTIK